MNKKGFTLTELLLVILLVGVLSIIASTAVFRHITSTRKDASLRNAVAYVAAVNDYNFISEGEDVITSGDVSTITPKLKDSFEGTKPISGTITVDSSTKKVTAASFVFKYYSVSYNGTNYTVTKN
ncbi:MAG: prepilin-type N-terminal cleavage/methylation domain-containing protein [Bacilli bacterium]|nr:prepilin-type N-terminal cleavage/methylation domain-containing protein [Bacilli bacterium]